MRRFAVFASLALLAFTTLSADAPLREEQVIYSILAFNGRDYSGTFCGEDSDTIYLIADTDNFLSVRKTFVYFWPITGELRTDMQSLNIPFVGALEVRRRRRKTDSVEMSIYTYYNVKGEYELNWRVDTGQNALEIHQESQDEMSAYYQAMEDYQRLATEYNNSANELSLQIGRLRNQGKDVTSLQEKLRSLAVPSEPLMPDRYVVPPVNPQLGFLLNLPAGEYTIAFVTDDGDTMEETEKTVVAFPGRRERVAGVEVIPGDRWTRSVDSRSASAAIYVDGSTDLYLRPYYQNEYIDLYYEKMKRNDARGNPDMMRWVQIQQIPLAGIGILESPGEAIAEQAFYIEQTSGASLGYLVVPFDPEGKHKGLYPSLKAFHLPLDGTKAGFRLQIFDRAGNRVPGGRRQVRVINDTRWTPVLLFIAAIPILVLGVVRIRRMRRYRSGEDDSA